MERTFFFVGKQVGGEDGRTMAVRTRSEGGQQDAWMVPMMEGERFGDYDEANAARRGMAEALGDGLEIYEAQMTLSVAKVERPVELKRTTII